ncbi:hypothetical protein GB937_009986 [Aspergillus fischeri]|nr:hypothetical protein GB937_009986 [Aspergillus fischeri]
MPQGDPGEADMALPKPRRSLASPKGMLSTGRAWLCRVTQFGLFTTIRTPENSVEQAANQPVTVYKRHATRAEA